jgi:carboxymethylenebutenolidase
VKFVKTDQQKTDMVFHEIYIYENAGHTFANEGGSRYNKEAADLAWKRIVTFLDKNL